MAVTGIKPILTTSRSIEKNSKIKRRVNYVRILDLRERENEREKERERERERKALAEHDAYMDTLCASIFM